MKLSKKILLINSLLLCGVTIAKGQQISNVSLITHSSALENSLGLLQQLKPVMFEYQPELGEKMQLESGLQMGFLPSEIKKVLPGLVIKTDKLVPSGKNSYQAIAIETVDYVKLIPVLVQALQQQEERINALQKELDDLKKNTSGK